MFRESILLTGALALASCHTSSASDSPAPAPARSSLATAPHERETASDELAIATLVTNDARVELLRGARARITRSNIGAPNETRVVAVADLRATDPDLYDLVTTATAGHGTIDARLYRHDLDRDDGSSLGSSRAR